MNPWYQTHSFSSPCLTAEQDLPPLSIIALDHLALITATGDDTLSYLQGQLTCDLISLPKTESTLAAHCDAKGKMWAVLRLFHHQAGIAYTVPQSSAETQLTQIKKYAVFSKVTFERSEQVLIGIAGDKANRTINLRFPGQGAVRQTQTGTAVQISDTRWLLAIDPQEADELIDSLSTKASLIEHQLWQYYELLDGIPWIEEENSLGFIPQAVNLQHLNAISFKKGCYTGQETVARAKYRGINKRATYLLSGRTDSPLIAGESFDRSIGENWRSGGTILYGMKFDNGQAFALVVLPNNLEEDTQFRRPDEAELWQKIELPTT